MPKKLELTGQRFGRLVVLCESDSEYGISRWLCQCDCGNQIIVRGRNLKYDTKSCGCLRKEQMKKAVVTHGESRTRLYIIWQQLRQRCRNSNSDCWKNYGGRGITVCDEWLHDFQAFYDWSVSNGYASDLSIDRINVNGNYEPDNCRWATRTMQGRNKRIKSSNKTGYSGVSVLSTGGYQVDIGVGGKVVHLGTYKTLEESVAARKAGEVKYWGKAE